MQRPDYRRIDGGCRTSKYVGSPTIDRPKGVCANECRAQYEYEPAEASRLASSGGTPSALWQPASSYPTGKSNGMTVGEMNRLPDDLAAAAADQNFQDRRRNNKVAAAIISHIPYRIFRSPLARSAITTPSAGNETLCSPADERLPSMR